MGGIPKAYLVEVALLAVVCAPYNCCYLVRAFSYPWIVTFTRSTATNSSLCWVYLFHQTKKWQKDDLQKSLGALTNLKW